MCRALLARPVDEPLLDGFHAWFGGLPAPRDGPEPVRALEVETLELWSRIVATAPDVMLVESRATRSFTTELEPVLRARSAWADPDDVGVLSVAFAAVISHVSVRSLGCGTAELSARLDRAFDLLAALHPSTALAAGV